MANLPGNGALTKVEEISDELVAIELQDTLNDGPIEENFVSKQAQDIPYVAPSVDKPNTPSSVGEISVDDDSVKTQATTRGGPTAAKERSLYDGTTRKDSPEEVYLIEYLFKRLHQLGVRSIFGVPGDYNLMALDYVQPCGLRWVGNANELNAGYAADGYARIRGLSALMTVMGVGELSAINAIAGAYTEKAPIVHIVGMPSTTSQRLRHNLHHTLGNGSFDTFSDFYRKVTCGQLMLGASSAGPDAHMDVMIDDILVQCLRESQPVYIGLATDLIKQKVSADRLDKPIKGHISFENRQLEGDERALVDMIGPIIGTSKRPVIVVDGFALRCGWRFVKMVNKFVRAWNIPTFTTPFGKGAVDETIPNFRGIYTGDVWWSKDDQKWVEPDLCILIVPLKTDTNTCCFTALSDVTKTIEIGQYDVSVYGKSYGYAGSSVLGGLACRHRYPYWPKRLKLDSRFSVRDRKKELEQLPEPCADAVIDQDSFWFRISKFFRPGDVILTETGTASSGGQDFVLPKYARMINSAAWLSIGYALGACVGATLGRMELEKRRLERPGIFLKGRTILFDGDGSFQMTAQAVSDIIRHRLDVIIFLINNDGYTMERVINGMDADYNDVQPWNYLESASYFGAPKDDPSYPVFAKRANKWGELFEIIEDPQLKAGKGFCMVEVMMRKDDAVASLKELVELAKQQNRAG